MEEFRIPKQEVPVEIVLQGGQEMTGQMFVPEVGADAHPEPLVDRLNDNERFLPFVREDSFEMVNKSCLVLVRIREPQGPEAAGPEGAPLEHHLSLELEHGMEVEGRVRYLMPHERSRLIDFLNVAPRFIEIIDDHVRTLVNSSFVLRIRSLTRDPA